MSTDLIPKLKEFQQSKARRLGQSPLGMRIVGRVVGLEDVGNSSALGPPKVSKV